MTRRDLLKHFGTMTAAACALPLVDLDKLIWVPKTIITVPAMPALEALDWADLGVTSFGYIFQYSDDKRGRLPEDIMAGAVPEEILRGKFTRGEWVGPIPAAEALKSKVHIIVKDSPEIQSSIDEVVRRGSLKFEWKEKELDWADLGPDLTSRRKSKKVTVSDRDSLTR